MISELSSENYADFRHDAGSPVLVAYLNQTTYSRQLKALLGLSENFNKILKIYVTRDVGLKATADAAVIRGTPTFVLLQDDKERDRLLGESDAQRLKNFVEANLVSHALL